MQCIKRNSVQERGERMIHVGHQVTRTANVDAKVGAAWPECGIDATQNSSRIDLVVDRIEGGDEVEAPALSEGSGVAHFKTSISQTA